MTEEVFFGNYQFRTFRLLKFADVPRNVTSSRRKIYNSVKSRLRSYYNSSHFQAVRAAVSAGNYFSLSNLEVGLP